MIAFNPDDLIVEDAGSTLDFDPDGSFGPVVHSKWQMHAPEYEGIAYIRITPQLRDFIKLCHDKHVVIGFEYDLDDMGLNLGLVLKNKAKE